MESTRSQARFAGLFYGLASASAPFAYLYVPGLLLVPGDAVATADHVRGSEALLRAAVCGELCSATWLIFAALSLYHLFKNVDPKLSLVTAAMILVSVPISFVNALIYLAPLLLLKSAAMVKVLGPGPAAAWMTLFLRLHNGGLLVNQILWGLWLFPIGMLVMRSGFIPRWLGIPLFLAGTGYVLNSVGAILLPPSLHWLTENLQVLGLGEAPFFSFYLLIWGARGYPVDRVAAALVVASFLIGVAGLALLMSHRISPVQYAISAVMYLAILVALVMRWRSVPDAPATA